MTGVDRTTEKEWIETMRVRSPNQKEKGEML